MIGLNWFTKSLLTVIFLLPFYIGLGFLQKNYNLRPELTFAFYFIGVGTGMFIWLLKISKIISLASFDAKIILLGLIIILFALTFGVAANILYAQALVDPDCPNMGLPIAIINSESVLVFVISYFLFVHFPKYFIAAEFNPIKLVGIALTIIGVAIISYKVS